MFLGTRVNDTTELYTFNVNYAADVFIIPVFATLVNETTGEFSEEYTDDVSISHIYIFIFQHL